LRRRVLQWQQHKRGPSSLDAVQESGYLTLTFWQ
jgi:hypothetical protein